jgi:triosephosphate isomerase
MTGVDLGSHTAPSAAASRRPMIGTSWKMNLLPSTAPPWLAVVLAGTADVTDRDLFVIPPFPAIAATQAALTGSHIRWGGQDVHPDDAGAHTGDVSAPMLADLGCTIAEIGHSERRRDHGETDALIGRKVRAALRWGLTPLMCVGEPRQGPATAAIALVEDQLHGALGSLDPVSIDRVVVAYEPVWAIGDGAKAASLDHVAAMHGAIRRWLDGRSAPSSRVLYGGSVDPANAPGLLATSDVDGVFVGRSALDPDAFIAIATIPLPVKEGRT